MNQLGRLNVDEFLQVKDVPDVYAIGDCNDVPEIKLAYGADTQGKFVADNLKLKHEGQAMKPYNVNSTFAFVCLHGRTCRRACVNASIDALYNQPFIKVPSPPSLCLLHLIFCFDLTEAYLRTCNQF